jgi:hypothetical protein
MAEICGIISGTIIGIHSNVRLASAEGGTAGGRVVHVSDSGGFTTMRRLSVLAAVTCNAPSTHWTSFSIQASDESAMVARYRTARGSSVSRLDRCHGKLLSDHPDLGAGP